jgi:low molecular weight protein-tyrosine phosphatase
VDVSSRRDTRDIIHKLGVRNGVGAPTKHGASHEVFGRILVVCVGNVCRSPIAACLLRHQVAGRAIQVGSAGLAALTGQPMDKFAEEVLAEHGIESADHCARQLTRELLQQHDLVLAMDKDQLASMRELAPEATGKMFLLDKWVASRDIPDPYRQRRGMFELVYTMIEQGVTAWLPHL